MTMIDCGYPQEFDKRAGRAQAIIDSALDSFGCEMEAAFFAQGRSQVRGSLSESGYKAFPIPDDVVTKLGSFFDQGLVEPFHTKVRHDFYSAYHSLETVDRLNKEQVYFRGAPEDAQEAIEKYLESIQDEICSELNHKFEVVNVRAWKSKPESEFGPTTWHRDGMPSFIQN